MVKTILTIEDDTDLRKYVEGLLLDQGYSVISAPDGVKALVLIEKRRPDLVILDLGLPKLSGESVCNEIRKKFPDLPIIILTAKNDMNDIVKGFNLGADDYVTKPFKGEELLARIKARLRHLEHNGNILRVGDLELNSKAFEVKRNNKLISLSHKEYELLQYLMINAGRVLTRDMILQRIWLTADYVEPRVVDVYIGYLRKKIDFNSSKKLINTVRGFGYVVKE
ncbi:MAG: Two component transcriptional regulator, winged helix family [Candidatus Gottesmanbacteria bacterium GW2011_GWC2_39_8]|uniref:Two component transcriptional regulator, winged helix family n=1 Tax=Candidatus Gottesmanbacteria bacterium GW2011_GWC2_39_8 TaxID=1618450 RepID=A0A0G0SGK6_9BACT|nr:MAG: Two component transcriptional regulator, winged helix family [Candidatus Gottesmanbacteria bacterium GW2011_GWC2_39_8]